MKYYFMGICGTAMGNVALLLREMGYEVCGVDEGVYPPMSEVLREGGVEVYEGYDAGRLERMRPGCVVVGNVISRGNVELEWLMKQDEVEYCSLAGLMHDVVLKGRRNIVITGTHGKTTTTAMTARVLEKMGMEPGYMVGGVPRDLGGGARLGKRGGVFVIEGDEYDTAFFDKRSKFIHYRPKVLVVNNIEFDHADIFRDIKDIQRSFSHLLKIVPGDGVVIINGDDRGIGELMPISWAPVVRVGVGEGNDLRIRDYRGVGGGRVAFRLEWKGEGWGELEWGLGGLYNARNGAMALLASAMGMGLRDPRELDINLLKDFQGVKRRQEVIYEGGGVVVVEDFGHHPTAVRETIEGLRERYGGRRVVACFEPRSNTACRGVHQEGFRDAFSVADSVYLGPVYRSELYREDDRLDIGKMAGELMGMGVRARDFRSNGELLEGLWEDEVEKKEEEGEVLICFFSNGAFGGIIKEFVKRMS